MSDRIGEMPVSRGRSSQTEEERRYWVAGLSDANAVTAAVLSFSPSVVVTLAATLFRKSADIGIDFTSSNYAEVTVPYGKPTGEEEAGSFSWGFDTTGGNVHITHGINTTRYPKAGQAAILDEGIGVHGKDIDGTEIIIPAMKLNASFRHPKGEVTLAKAFQLFDITGTTNANVFLTRPVGSMLYLGGTGSDGSNAEATVAHQFAYSPNLQNELIAGIQVASKLGWEYAWIKYKPAEDANDNPIQEAVQVNVEQVYKSSNFAATLGFG